MDKDIDKFIDNLNKWFDIDNLNKLQKIFLLVSIGFLISSIIAFIFKSNYNIWNDAHLYPLAFSFVAYIGMRLFKPKK